ncbi:hypothetical protein [Burkholderia multivorans]|uniref:hypothetical protein n=1 Tax=Burkholderia multivorans TaxID=87883 RepID=UPI001C2224C5|nr:hypothetical protein [Burkholderia multivorans]MBU9340674.1 hypothetical protein [Burkholderia multivorans]WVN03747.1 hypothetical protein V1241_16525 [Burkholderia multivorans]
MNEINEAAPDGEIPGATAVLRELLRAKALPCEPGALARLRGESLQSAWAAAQAVLAATVAQPELLKTDPYMVLEMIAADVDAGNSRLTSGLLVMLHDVLVKAGRKEAPTPVRHIRTCGEGL